MQKTAARLKSYSNPTVRLMVHAKVKDDETGHVYIEPVRCIASPIAKGPKVSQEALRLTITSYLLLNT